MKKFLAILALSFILLAPTTALWAQLDDGDQVIDYEEDVPFDGGLSLLLAAGLGLGAKKAYNSRKKKTDEGKESL